MINYLKIEKTEDTVASDVDFAPKEKTYLLESGELFSEEISEKYNSTNLVENMNFDSSSNLYYKIITDLSEYEIFKEEIELPELTEQKFQNYFAIIIFNDSQREMDESDLEIIKVYSIGSETHIILHQKDDANAFQLNNVFYAIAEKSQLEASIVIDIND